MNKKKICRMMRCVTVFTVQVLFENLVRTARKLILNSYIRSLTNYQSNYQNMFRLCSYGSLPPDLLWFSYLSLNCFFFSQFWEAIESTILSFLSYKLFKLWGKFSKNCSFIPWIIASFDWEDVYNLKNQRID